MTEREIKKLSRADLLELLIDQSKELQRTQQSLQEAQKELNRRQIALDEAGSIADAALRLSGIFEAAEASCALYAENIRNLSSRQEEICRRREQESLEKAALRIVETEERCAAILSDAKERSDFILNKARTEAEAYWQEIFQRVEDFCTKHPELCKEMNISLDMNR